VGVISAVLALTAVAPSLAGAFVVSQPGGATKGVAIGEQKFKLKGFTIKCQKGKSEGTATSVEAIVDKVTFGKCSTGGKGDKFEGPLDLEYKTNGTVDILEPVTIKVSAAKCLATIDAGSLPPEEVKALPVSYATEIFESTKKKFLEKFPSGKQEKLLITNKFKGMEYELEAISEKGECAELESTEGENGTYKGELRDELPEGDLGI